MDTVQTIHPSGRVQILDSPISLPGKCVLCGASDNNDGRQYIDIGFELDFYGVIYFCTHCLQEVSAAAGFFPAHLVESLKLEIHNLAEDKMKVDAENVKLRVALNNLDFLGTNADYNPANSSSEESVNDSKSDNTKSSKPFDESGHTNIPKTRKSKSISDEYEDLEL